MSTRTLPRLPRPRKATSPRTITISEDYQPGSGKLLQVDRDAGIIHRIKILGWDSRNGRRYLPEAVSRKLSLYEGAKAYSNHPAKATDMRDTEDLLGIWHKPVVEADGVYANLHYLKSHPLCERLCEDAERGLGLFTASHNADGRGKEDSAGILIIIEILKVRSVDLVTDGATVTNLRESHMQPQQTTLRQLIEVNASRKATFGKLLLEMPGDMGDLPMDVPPDDTAAEPTGDWKADLVAAIGKLVSSEDEADHKTAQKIMAMLKPGAAAPAETTTEGEEDDTAKKKKDDEDKKMEAAKAAALAPGAILLTEAKAKQFCTLAGLDPAKEKTLLEAMTSGTEDTALKLLEWAKSKVAPARSNGVRAQGPIGLHTPGTSTVAPVKSLEEFERRILR